MKKRTAVIGALVSLMPLGQPLLIGGGAAVTSAAVMLSVPEKVNAQTKYFICEDLETYTGSAKDLETLNNETWYLTIKEKEQTIQVYKPFNDITYNLSIVSSNSSTIIGTEHQISFPGSSSLVLDLKTLRLTFAAHTLYLPRQSVSLHYGRCRRT